MTFRVSWAVEKNRRCDFCKLCWMQSIILEYEGHEVEACYELIMDWLFKRELCGWFCNFGTGLVWFEIFGWDLTKFWWIFDWLFVYFRWNFWSILNRILADFRQNFGRFLTKFWQIFDRILADFWTNFGRLLTEFCQIFDRILADFWPNFSKFLMTFDNKTDFNFVAEH